MSESMNCMHSFSAAGKRKTILTVQHTESEHHINGHIGAWGDWALTEHGKQQAYEIGKWLLREDCNRGFSLYVSDQRRALQTAEATSGVLAMDTTLIADVSSTELMERQFLMEEGDSLLFPLTEKFSERTALSNWLKSSSPTASMTISSFITSI